MREGGADTAAVEVHDMSILAAREDDTPVEGIAALRVDQAGALEQLEGVALVREMTPQIPARGVADAQFFDQNRIAHSALFEIAACFRVMRQFPLIESSRLLQHGARVGRGIWLLEAGEALAKSEMPR